MNSLYIHVLRTYRQRLLVLLVGLGLLSFPLAFAYASSSVSIQSLSPSTTVSVGTNVSFTVATSGFSNPTYTVSDSFSGSTVGNGNINTSGNFSWTPTSSDVGTHNLTISISDSTGNSATVQEQLTVGAQASLSIQSLSPSSSVGTGQTLTFTAVAAGFTNPTYSVSDSFSGTSLAGGDITTSGVFTWAPQAQDAGSHTITVTATDSAGHTATAQEQVTVNSTPTTIIQGLSPGSTIGPGAPLTFTVAVSGFTSPSYTVSDSFAGSTVSNADINSSGAFSWTPTANQIGSHTLTVYVTDSAGHSANVSQQVTVVVPSLIITSVSPSLSVSAGTRLLMTLSAPGLISPTYSMADSFGGTSVVSGDVSSAGVFTWTPGGSDVGTHTFTFSATDSAGHSAQTSITAVVTSAAAAVVPVVSGNSSSSLSSAQVSAIISLLQSFGADSATVASVSAALGVAGSTSSTTAGDGYVFADLLDLGSSGNAITELQNRLTALGVYTGPITGYFGSLTKAAVQQLQSAHGIAPVGYVGPATRAVLNGQ